MKKYITLTFFIMLCMNFHAQTSMSENELKSYFERNISDLNPIEGIYFVKSSTNLFFKDEVNTYIRALIFSKQMNAYEELYFDKDTNKYKFLQKVQYDKATHIFRYISNNGQSVVSEYIVSNPSHFILDSSDQYTYCYDEYTRLYPTEEMFANANLENRIQEACNLIENKFFSSALAILNDVLKSQNSPQIYYYRASAYYGLKDFYSAIQDCNKALSYNVSANNASMVYYLRGLCNFLVNNEESGIADMKMAGEDGLKFLEEQGYTKPSANTQNKGTNKTSPTKRSNSTPVLKKTK